MGRAASGRAAAGRSSGLGQIKQADHKESKTEEEERKKASGRQQERRKGRSAMCRDLNKRLVNEDIWML